MRWNQESIVHAKARAVSEYLENHRSQFGHYTTAAATMGFRNDDEPVEVFLDPETYLNANLPELRPADRPYIHQHGYRAVLVLYRKGVAAQIWAMESNRTSPRVVLKLVE